MTLLWIAWAGSAGAIARFVLDGAIRRRRATEFPWATVLINVAGSLILGVITGLALFHDAPQQVLLIVGVGFCGGFTTFSTASFETGRLIQRKRYAAGAANMVGTALAAVAAGGIGLALAWM